MLPVYKAHSFVKQLTEGGRTRPWALQALVGGQPVPHVVKMFSVNEVNQQAVVSREVTGAVLARAFDLQTPSPALIHLGSDFLNTLPEAQRQRLSDDYRPKFGTAYHEGLPVFDPKRHRQTLRDYTEIDTVFAFDNLIWNVDRTLRKPNTLVTSTEIVLIDHELSQDIPGHFRQLLADQPWTFPHESHIFYPYLKRKKTQDKKQLFGTFADYLRMLNPEVLNPYTQQLKGFQCPVEYVETLKAYLYFMREKSSRFVTLLQSLIQ